MSPITVLDGHTLNPGDLGWSSLEQLGPCTIHARTPADLTVKRSLGAVILLTNKVVLDAATLSQLPALRYIGVMATGYNVVDIAAARQRSIMVTNVPGYGTRSVAQTTFALLLELAHGTGAHSQGVRAGDWSHQPDFSYWNQPLVELDGLTLGLVGCGDIGRVVADIARSFGMRVLVHKRHPDPALTGVKFVDLDTLFRESDVISLHCPLTPETKELVNARSLALMKPSAFLINTARGPLIHEPSLADALNNNRIAGAALDVLSTEPPPAEHPLLTAKNCLVTPHFAWATKASRERLMTTTVANVAAFLSGKPQNVVS